MAPELFAERVTDISKVDIFSLGVVLVNLLTGCKYSFESNLEQCPKANLI